MRAYQDMVYSTVVRLTANGAQAEDIAQEVFLRAYESFETLRASPSAGGWLKTVATNLTLNHLQRYRRRWRLLSEIFDADEREEQLDPALASMDAHFAAADAEQRGALVRAALAELPAHQRIPLVLYHYEEMSYREIADRLDRSLAKVKSDIFRGRVALAKRLAARGLGSAAAGTGESP